MEKELTNKNEKSPIDPIVIADECGDSMWDAVFGQEIKICDVKVSPKDALSLLTDIEKD